MTKKPNLIKAQTGWGIYNPKGGHYFTGYDGQGGYYSALRPDGAYLFQSKDNATAMARRLKGKTLLVVKIVKSVEVEFSHSEKVVADPL